MKQIEWDDRLATGVTAIDSQHREIYKRFNGLLKACERGHSRDEIVSILHFMNNYITHHFQDEEKLQRKAQYPELISHKHDHERLAKKFRALETRLQTTGATVQLVIQTGKLLSELLFEHIHEKDGALADFMRNRLPTEI